MYKFMVAFLKIKLKNSFVLKKKYKKTFLLL